MSELLGWFVHQPLRVAVLAFACWEWLVITRTPEADIRVDLLLIWPIGLIVITWALVRLLRR